MDVGVVEGVEEVGEAVVVAGDGEVGEGDSRRTVGGRSRIRSECAARLVESCRQRSARALYRLPRNCFEQAWSSTYERTCSAESQTAHGRYWTVTSCIIVQKYEGFQFLRAQIAGQWDLFRSLHSSLQLYNVRRLRHLDI